MVATALAAAPAHATASVYKKIAALGLSYTPSTAAVDPSRRKLFIADLGELRVFDAGTHALLAKVPLIPGPRSGKVVPGGLALDGALGKVYVADNTNNLVYVVDEATSSVTAKINVGRQPVGIAVDERHH